ncbi:uncharacterized protein [Watersipora subatra]|uniref:uncharacterized protein n=1 Tax=Watersipora subatra TaxID=2589382 RepID=UPI00355C38EF
MENCCNCVPQRFLTGDMKEDDIKENVRIIEIHRSLVYAIGKTVYPEYNFIGHDLSKFSSAELEPYTIKFVNKAPDSENPAWESALEHHYKNNPHHPQYWEGKPMPEEFLKESIIDMLAARYQYAEAKEVLPDQLQPEMFDVQPMYLTRYIDSDKKRVQDELDRLKAIDWHAVPIQGLNFSISSKK